MIVSQSSPQVEKVEEVKEVKEVKVANQVKRYNALS
jgi:hypothetical protein